MPVDMSEMEDAAGARLTIDLDAVVRNYRRLADRTEAAVAAVVKADAYGLGAAAVAAALGRAGCQTFFVAQLGEAPAVRAAIPPSATLYVLNGLPPGTEARCAAIGAVPVLNSLEQIERWRALATTAGTVLAAALQCDTGMNRIGLPPADVAVLAREPGRLAGIDVRLVMSHLACADEPDAAANAVQRHAFDQLAAMLPNVPRSLANSGGILLGPAYHYDLVRPGIALYGGNPQPGSGNPMEPVVALTAPLMQVRDVPAGQGLGYGLTAASDAARRIGVISVGYADGWPRHLGNRGSAFIGDVRVPLVGIASMDSILIDVTAVPAAGAGTIVELLGPHQAIDDVARDAGTISYEILTQLGARYSRQWVRYASGDDRKAAA